MIDKASKQEIKRASVDAEMRGLTLAAVPSDDGKHIAGWTLLRGNEIVWCGQSLPSTDTIDDVAKTC